MVRGSVEIKLRAWSEQHEIRASDDILGQVWQDFADFGSDRKAELVDLKTLGDLSKPATALIDRVAEGITGLARPYQIERVARAEANAEKIKALAKLEIAEIEQRGLLRAVAEQGRHQANIESITRKALPNLAANADPSKVDLDWIAHFFDRARLASDEEMQSLWGRILAGEANKPGSFARRTVQFVSAMEKSDAEMFTRLCGFCWDICGTVPVILSDGPLEGSVYDKNGIGRTELRHLAEIGLTSAQGLAEITRGPADRPVTISYFGTSYDVCVERSPHQINVGSYQFTRVGLELAPISGATEVAGFREHVLTMWTKFRYAIQQLPRE